MKKASTKKRAYDSPKEGCEIGRTPADKLEEIRQMSRLKEWC
jgi:hypothetical protein